ncbi:MAG: ArnT family glycosyltransferase [Acetatifactor sp.]
MNKLQNTRKWIAKHLPFALFALLLLVFAVTRLWRLLTLPSGFHSDEAGMAYDAWCLSQYGVDRYLKSFPVYLTNFGEGQSALYAYLTAGLFRLFGFHEILIRIPGVFFSFLTLIFGMLLVRKIFPGRPYLVLGAGFLLTVCPYFILASRFGLDCNLMLGASTVFLYFFANALGTGKYRYYILAGITGGLTLYSYILSYLMMPLFLLLSLIYVISIRRFSFQKWVAMAIPMFLLAFPLILTQCINLFDWEEMQLGIFTLTKLEGYRSSELQPVSLGSFKLVVNDIFIGDMWVHNSIPGIPNMYWISIPLIVIGLTHTIYKTVISFRRRSLDITVLALWWFLSVFFIVCHITPCINQLNSIFFVLVLFVVDAVSLIPPLRKWGSAAIKASIAGIYVFCFFRFATYYYLGQYTADNYPLGYFDIRVSDAITFIEEHPQYGPKGTQMAELPIYFALSTLYSPYDLQLFNSHELYLMDGYYHCNCLGEIEDGYNYIVRDVYGVYADKLRTAGFTEINYGNYSLFYQEQ